MTRTNGAANTSWMKAARRLFLRFYDLAVFVFPFKFERMDVLRGPG